MYEILSARIQILNGSHVVKQIPVKKQAELSSPEEVEKYRRDMIAKYKPKILEWFKKKHPGERLPEVDILLNVRCKEGYAQGMKSKSAKTQP